MKCKVTLSASQWGPTLEEKVQQQTVSPVAVLIVIICTVINFMEMRDTFHVMLQETTKLMIVSFIA